MAGSDTMYGGAGNDKMYGNGSGDWMDGGDGDDWLYGNGGADKMYGGAGSDHLYGNSSADWMDGGAGDDWLYGDGGNDTLYGGEGNDYIDGQSGSDVILGGAGNDTLKGSDGDDVILGQAGNDYIEGGSDRDLIDGGTGDDTVKGGDDSDVILGGTGADKLYGENGNDLLDGEDGDDQLFGGSGDDILTGGAGNDLVQGDADKDKLEGGLGSDTLKSDSKDTVVEQETRAASFGLKAFFQSFAYHYGVSGFSYVDPTGGSSTAVDRPVRSWIGTYEAAIPGSAETMLAGGDSHGAGGPSLTEVALAPIVDAAIERWTQILGAGDTRLAALDSLVVNIADLGGDALGDTLGSTITLDVDAAGHGWFVDLTPLDDSEFAVSAEASTLTALPGSGAVARMDLVTVLMHEMGHVMGFEHTDAGEHAEMDAHLELGVRLLDAAGIDHDPDAPVSDATLHALAAKAVELGFDLDSGGKGASGVIDWQVKSSSSADAGWTSEYSPYVANKQAKDGAKNFSDYLVKGFDSLGKTLLGKRK